MRQLSVLIAAGVVVYALFDRPRVDTFLTLVAVITLLASALATYDP